MVDVTFGNPGYLWLLISIPLIIITHFFMLRHLKTRAWKFANIEAIKRVTGGAPSMKNSFILSKNIFLLVIKIIILLALILSIASPTVWYVGLATENNFVLAIDSSSSMLADDFDPNRFVAAKKAAIGFLDSISARTNVGVVSFAGTAFAELQLTENKNTVAEKIALLGIKKVGGTDLGDAIVTSVNILLADDKPKTIILLTDGRSTTGESVLEGVTYANDNAVRIFTIGVATKKGGNFLKIEALSTLDSESLTQIAELTNGKYYQAVSEDDLERAYSEIASSVEQKLSIRLQFPLLLLALALIFVEWGLINTRYRTLP